MNEKNFDYLKDQVMYTGFGEALEGELRQNMEKLQTEFKLQHDAFYGNDKIAAELNFRKSEQSDLYFFNSYNVKLQKEGHNESLKQTFYINNRGSNITLKEAYNLMEGRSVHKELINKEGESYNAWLQLDFKNSDTRGNFTINHYHENYGFDLEASLSKYDIKELATAKYKDDLLSSLKKGNLQSATFIKEGKEVKQHIEANPQFKTITVYDTNMKRLDTRQRNAEQQVKTQEATNEKNSQRTKVKSEDNEEAADEGTKNNKRRKAQSM